MLEIVKVVGGIAWVVGVILLFVAPALGWLVLAGALALSIVSLNRTREKRHQELLDAVRDR